MLNQPKSSAKPKGFQTNPKFAIAFCEVEGIDEVLATYHKIEQGILKSGKPVDANFIISKISDIKAGKSIKVPLTQQLIDTSIILSNDDYLIWHTKSTNNKSMWFRGQITTEVKNAPYPSLVFVLQRKTRSLFVYAKCTNTRPTPNTRLYVAPLCNIASNGHVCQGSAPVPKSDFRDEVLAQKCQDTIFGSNFTHVNNPKTFRLKDEKAISTKLHIKQWQQLATQQKKPSSRQMTYFMTFGETLALLEKKQ